jgi:rubredoxin
MRDRSFRKNAEEKRKAWARKLGREWYNNEPTDRQVGILAHSPHKCSCPMCGNPRKHFKKKTLQELRHFQKDFYDEI